MCETPCVKISSYNDAVYYINKYAHVLEAIKDGATPEEKDINIFVAALTVFIYKKARRKTYFSKLCSIVGGVESLDELVGQFWEKKINSVATKYDPSKKTLSEFLQKIITNFFLDMMRKDKRDNPAPPNELDEDLSTFNPTDSSFKPYSPYVFKHPGRSNKHDENACAPYEPAKKNYQPDFTAAAAKFIDSDYYLELIEERRIRNLKKIENLFAVIDAYPFRNKLENIERRLVYHGKRIQGEIFKQELGITDPYRILNECKTKSFEMTSGMINNNYQSFLKYSTTFMDNICNQICELNLKNVEFLKNVDTSTRNGKQIISNWIHDINTHLQNTLENI